MVVHEMKPTGKLYPKDPVFSLYPTHHKFCAYFEGKSGETLAIVHDVLQKVSRVYRLEHKFYSF
jgi:hypothetical protein